MNLLGSSKGQSNSQGAVMEMNLQIAQLGWPDSKSSGPFTYTIVPFRLQKRNCN